MIFLVEYQFSNFPVSNGVQPQLKIAFCFSPSPFLALLQTSPTSVTSRLRVDAAPQINRSSKNALYQLFQWLDPEMQQYFFSAVLLFGQYEATLQL